MPTKPSTWPASSGRSDSSRSAKSPAASPTSSRNPLNVVKTSAYFLINARNPSPEKTAEHLRRIGQHVAAADGVITALSNFAKMPLPTLEPFSVEACVRDALAANPVPGNVTLELDFPPDLPHALGDASQISIVFANLIRNARDAMQAGGRLTVTGRAVDGRDRRGVRRFRCRHRP